MSYAGQVETGGLSPSPIGSTLYGVCNQAANDPDKIVVLPDYDELVVGTTVHVKFTNGNTAENPTLQVGSSTPPGGVVPPIYQYGTIAPGTTEATSWRANSVVSFTYDGTAWRMNDAGANAAIIAYTDSKVAAEATARENSIVKKIASPFSTSATYQTGELCIYNETLYRCTTAVTTAGAWNAAKWTAVTLSAADKPRTGTISMPAASWTGAGPWTQTVTVTGTAVYQTSMVSLQPNATVFGHMASVGCAAIFVTNNNGTLTATAVQKKPTSNLTVQCTVTEIQ